MEDPLETHGQAQARQNREFAEAEHILIKRNAELTQAVQLWKQTQTLLEKENIDKEKKLRRGARRKQLAATDALSLLQLGGLNRCMSSCAECEAKQYAVAWKGGCLIIAVRSTMILTIWCFCNFAFICRFDRPVGPKSDVHKLAEQREAIAALQTDLARKEESCHALQLIIERLEQQVLAETVRHVTQHKHPTNNKFLNASRPMNVPAPNMPSNHHHHNE